MSHDHSLTVIIPAYDENENLESLVPSVIFELNKLSLASFQIIVVMRKNEGQESLNNIEALGARSIQRAGDDSFGSAIKTGIQVCGTSTSHLLFMDADGSHSPHSIPKLWRASLDYSADVVIASRYVKGGSTANSWLEIQMSRMLNAIYSIVLGIGAKDISTNFKIYRTELLENLNLRCSNYDIVEELLLKIKRKKKALLIVEIPDHFEQRQFGESKRKLSVFIASYVITLFRLRFMRQNK
ncbi:dolichyl-phosphate beta-D-mannosyltransferase [Candidatus Nanopelagicaceae bacterium]